MRSCVRARARARVGGWHRYALVCDCAFVLIRALRAGDYRAGAWHCPAPGSPGAPVRRDPRRPRRARPAGGRQGPLRPVCFALLGLAALGGRLKRSPVLAHYMLCFSICKDWSAVIRHLSELISARISLVVFLYVLMYTYYIVYFLFEFHASTNDW